MIVRVRVQKVAVTRKWVCNRLDLSRPCSLVFLCKRKQVANCNALNARRLQVVNKRHLVWQVHPHSHLQHDKWKKKQVCFFYEFLWFFFFHPKSLAPGRFSSSQSTFNFCIIFHNKRKSTQGLLAGFPEVLHIDPPSTNLPLQLVPKIFKTFLPTSYIVIPLGLVLGSVCSSKLSIWSIVESPTSPSWRSAKKPRVFNDSAH